MNKEKIQTTQGSRTVPAQADEASMRGAEKDDPILCIRSLLGKEIELINDF